MYLVKSGMATWTNFFAIKIKVIPLFIQIWKTTIWNKGIDLLNYCFLNYSSSTWWCRQCRCCSSRWRSYHYVATWCSTHTHSGVIWRTRMMTLHSFLSNRVDIVWDENVPNSLKTREKPGTSRRVQPETKIPRKWKAFLWIDENKMELFAFLAQQCIQIHSDGKVVSTLGILTILLKIP